MGFVKHSISRCFDLWQYLLRGAIENGVCFYQLVGVLLTLLPAGLLRFVCSLTQLLLLYG